MSNHNSPQPTEQPEGESFVSILHNGEKWYWCKCEDCGWENSSEYAAGGSPIADTGDYSDPMCPVCGSLKIDGESKYFKDEDYKKSIVIIPFDEFIAPYNRVIDDKNRLESEKYWSGVEENGGLETEPLPSQPSVDALGEEQKAEIIANIISAYENNDYSTWPKCTHEEFLKLHQIRLAEIFDNNHAALASHPFPSVDAEPSPQEPSKK